jgi:hypothetical protein
MKSYRIDDDANELIYRGARLGELARANALGPILCHTARDRAHQFDAERREP